jgi:hypothetical protein
MARRSSDDGRRGGVPVMVESLPALVLAALAAALLLASGAVPAAAPAPEAARVSRSSPQWRGDPPPSAAHLPTRPHR